MKYTEKQIENAKKRYNKFLRHKTPYDFEIKTIGMQEAIRRSEYHNSIVDAILAGDKELERKWKLFFLNDEAKKDQKREESLSKQEANLAASAQILEPIIRLRKMTAFSKWLNTYGNPYRSQHFSKKYTAEAVNAFLATLNV
jgi:hypothetical protein